MNMETKITTENQTTVNIVLPRIYSLKVECFGELAKNRLPKKYQNLKGDIKGGCVKMK